MTTISFVDVGQGDCTVIVDESGDALVIDCPRKKHETAAAELEAQGWLRLSTAIITHSDEDHAGGMADLLELLGERFDGDLFYNVDSVLAIPVIGPDHKIAGQRRRALLNRFREYDDRVKDVRYGVVGSVGKARWELLAPTPKELRDAIGDGDPNLASGIVLITVDGIDTIVGGDAPLTTWERIKDQVPKGATVRWPHHGGRISDRDQLEAQARLFAILDPREVIVSVGSNNGHSHPFQEFFQVRQSHGAKLICTEATGTCFAGGVGGSPCAGTIRLAVNSTGYRLEVDAPDLDARIRSFGNAQCTQQILSAE